MTNPRTMAVGLAVAAILVAGTPPRAHAACDVLYPPDIYEFRGFDIGPVGGEWLLVAGRPDDIVAMRLAASPAPSISNEAAAWQPVIPDGTREVIAAAYGPGAALVLFHDCASGILAVILKADGTVAAPEVIVTSGDNPLAGVNASVAFDGTDFLVAWLDGDRTLARRIAADGTVLDADPIIVATNLGVPVIASNGDGWLLVSQGMGGARVTRTGEVVPLGILTEVGSAVGGYMALASNGEDYVLVFYAGLDGPGIYALHIDAAGLPLGVEKILADETTAGSTTIDVAANGNEYLAVFALADWSAPEPVHVLRLSAAGVLMSQAAIPLPIGATRYATPRVASNGESWLVVFAGISASAVYELWPVKVTADGVVLDPPVVASYPESNGYAGYTGCAVAGGPGANMPLPIAPLALALAFALRRRRRNGPAAAAGR